MESKTATTAGVSRDPESYCKTPKPEPGVRFVLTLEARPGVEGVRALKWLLKTLGRQHGFRCLDVREAQSPRPRRVSPPLYSPTRGRQWR